MKPDYKFSRNQLLSLCTITFLAPALRTFPAAAAKAAGKAAWLSAPAALPVLLGYVLLLSRFMDRAGENEGLAELCLRILGAKAGRIALGLFALWYLLYGAFVLRTGADRLITTVYPHTSPKFFVVTMGLLCLFAVLCPLRSILRTAKIVLPAVLGVLFLMLLFGLFSVDSSNLLPIRLRDLVPVLKAGGSALNVCVGVLYTACFLGGMVKPQKGRAVSYGLWSCFAAALLSVLSLTITGCFGPRLTSRLSRPFFSLVRSLVFFGNIERLEALLVSLWIFPDFLLVSLVLCCAQHCLRLCVGIRFGGEAPKAFDFSRGRWLIWLSATLVILLGMFMAPDTPRLELWSGKIIPGINLGVAFLLVPGLYIFGLITKKP